MLLARVAAGRSHGCAHLRDILPRRVDGVAPPWVPDFGHPALGRLTVPRDRSRIFGADRPGADGEGSLMRLRVLTLNVQNDEGDAASLRSSRSGRPTPPRSTGGRWSSRFRCRGWASSR